jgi:beta-lactamase class A
MCPEARPPRKIRITRVLLTALILFFSFFFIIKAGQRFRNAQPDSEVSNPVPLASSDKIDPGNTGSLTPSQKPAVSISKQHKKNMETLEKLVKKDLEGFPGQPSVIFYDFESDGKISLNSNIVMEAASLIKIPVMLEVYRQISEGNLRADKELVLQDSYKTGGAGILKDEKAGTHWTVEKLTELMITGSDNTATDMLIDLVGMERVEQTAKQIGLTQTTLKRKIFDFDQIYKGLDNLTTAEDMLIIYRELYEGDAFREKHRGMMLNILKGQKNKKIIPKHLPEDVQVAHKTGGLLGIVHDAGIVYPVSRKPYVLILMSDNVINTEKAEEHFAGLSKKIYDFVSKDR